MAEIIFFVAVRKRRLAMSEGVDPARQRANWGVESGSRPTPLPRVVQRLARDLELVCRGYSVFDPVAQLSFKQLALIQLNGSQPRPLSADAL